MFTGEGAPKYLPRGDKSLPCGRRVIRHVHSKKRASDDVGDSPLGSTAFRGGTDTNLFLVKKGSQRVLSSENRWGKQLDETEVIFDEQRQEMALGRKVEEITHAASEYNKANNTKRIKDALFDCVIKLGSPTHQELLLSVNGNAQAKIAGIHSLLEEGTLVMKGSGRKGDPKRYIPHVSEAAPLASAVQ
jgi:hypothetical protein